MFAALLPMLVSALVPVAADGARGLFSWLTRGSGAQPQNIDERIKLMDAETARLKVLAELDRPAGHISTWVADLRGAFRYIGAGAVILPLPFMLAWAMYSPVEGRLDLLSVYATDFAGPVWGFMFGDRLRLHIRK